MKLLVRKCGLHAKQILKNFSDSLVNTSTLHCTEKIPIPFLGLCSGEGHPVSEVYLADKIVSLVQIKVFVLFLLYMYESMRAMFEKPKPGNAEAIKGK